MNVVEVASNPPPRRQLDRGDELPAALLRALGARPRPRRLDRGHRHASRPRSWRCSTPHRSGYAPARRIETPMRVVLARRQPGAPRGRRPSASLPRRSPARPRRASRSSPGTWLWARVFALELSRHRLRRPRRSSRVARRAHRAWPALQATAAAPAASPARAHRRSRERQPPVAAAFTRRRAAPRARPIPVRPVRPTRRAPSTIPKPGDLVNHFHFGECTSSAPTASASAFARSATAACARSRSPCSGSSRPTTDPATGKRHFQLGPQELAPIERSRASSESSGS